MKKKAVTITNAMREDIAMELTARAVKKAATKIAAQLDRINATYWKAHQARVRKLSGLTDVKIKQLIGGGMIAATTTAEPCVIPEREDRRSVPQYFCEVSTSRIRSDPEPFAYRLLTNKFRDIRKHLGTPGTRFSVTAMVFKAESSVPRLNDMGVITDAKLLANIRKVEADLATMLSAAEQFHEDISLVLRSCRTSKQLEDLLPEAAKLVPQPVERTTDLAPVELAKSVEQMLKKGIPEESRAA